MATLQKGSGMGGPTCKIRNGQENQSFWVFRFGALRDASSSWYRGLCRQYCRLFVSNRTQKGFCCQCHRHLFFFPYHLGIVHIRSRYLIIRFSLKQGSIPQAAFYNSSHWPILRHLQLEVQRWGLVLRYLSLE